MFPFPVLISDIGGTHARFAVLRTSGSSLERLGTSHTADFPAFSDALRAVLARENIAPKSILICAAGPVDGASVQLTNAKWSIHGPAIAEEFGLSQGLIFNDFEALALSIPAFQREWTKIIGDLETSPVGARVIHGPGTGLGTAALIEVEGKWRAIPSEGAHSDFAPVYDDEHRLWPFIETRLGRITPESLISGPGLRRLHRARLASMAMDRPDYSEAEIIGKAVGDPASLEGESCKLFWRLTARYAGDVALNFLSTGGVYLAGGILPRISGLCDGAEFRRIFENKAPYDALARRIPTWLLTEPDVVLRGMAEIAQNPDDYAINYAERAWVV